MNTYKGWKISHVTPPIPIRSMDWEGVHEDYDPPDDRLVYGPNREDVINQIDEHEMENSI